MTAPADNPVNGLRTAFVEAMSLTAATVNIVTTDGTAGRAGVTVSAMTSVSADGTAPCLLVCIHHRSAACSAILRNGVFCLNVLRDDQAHISDTFAGRGLAQDADKFACATWRRQPTGSPRVVDPLAAFDCRLTHSERVGTHHVLFGAVEDIFMAGRSLPLIYTGRGYATPVRLPNGAPDDGCR
ncbi:MAG: flavin reductase [Hyphomicrobiales bacterium]|nr:flavin reductase [Hyphomicrobiales bacterium]